MVYFAQPINGGPVKIGCSADVPTRIRQLEAHYGQPLALLATFPGGPAEERAIHAMFAHLRFGRTEQFQPAADLMSFLGRPLLVGPNPAAVEVMPFNRCGRLDNEAIKWARIACGYTGETLPDYISRIIVERAKQDVARLHPLAFASP